MKIVSKIVFILMSALTASSIGFAQEISNSNLWRGSSAYTIPAREVEFSLLQPLRLGLSSSVEISAHPILFLVDPNLGLKIRLHESNNLLISSTHNISVPTPMLRLFQMKGAGGLISSQYRIPTIVTIYNGILLSRVYNKSILTAELGFYLATGTSRLDNSSSIDLPVIYPRLAALYHQPEFFLSVNFNSIISNHFNYFLKADSYLRPNCIENLFIEESGFIQWIPRTRFMLQAGYKLCYGRYPFGSQWTLLPDLDLVFHFGGSKTEGGDSNK